MLPSASTNNITNSRLINFILSGKYSLGNIAHIISSNNVLHISLRQFGKGASFSSRYQVRPDPTPMCIAPGDTLRLSKRPISIAAFGKHIFVVISLVAKEQVFRAYTRGVITMMQYMQGVWDWTIVDFPRDSMGKQQSLGAIRSTASDEAIALWPMIARPHPTLAQFRAMFRNGPIFVDLIPETFVKRYNQATSIAFARTKDMLPFLKYRGKSCDWLCTYCTRYIHRAAVLSTSYHTLYHVRGT